MPRSSFTHEFKSPINRIRGLVQILCTDQQLNAHDRVAIQGMVDVNTIRLQRSSESLLLHTFWDEYSLIKEHIDTAQLDTVVKACTERNRIGLDTEIRSESHAGASNCALDIAAWEMAIDHLINNALKFGGHAPVDVFLRIETDEIVFRIKDRGPGMANVTQATEAFWQASEGLSREKNGLGLGLSLAHRIAEAHGGMLSLSSQPGDGFEAILRIPNSIE